MENEWNKFYVQITKNPFAKIHKFVRDRSDSTIVVQLYCFSNNTEDNFYIFTT